MAVAKFLDTDEGDFGCFFRRCFFDDHGPVA